MLRRSWEARLLTGAAIVGVIHAAFSLFWALGGRWLLPTVGQWAVDYAREAPLTTGILLSFVAGMKCAVAITPLLASQGRLPHPRIWRGLAWIAALVLTGYGAVNSIVAWLVLGGVLRPEGGFDRQSMNGHAYLWDPLFLVWGLLLGAGLLVGARDRPGRAQPS
jgi:multisubunit Na+/H+ antiporter MnhB subunit